MKSVLSLMVVFSCLFVNGAFASDKRSGSNGKRAPSPTVFTFGAFVEPADRGHEAPPLAPELLVEFNDASGTISTPVEVVDPEARRRNIMPDTPRAQLLNDRRRLKLQKMIAASTGDNSAAPTKRLGPSTVQSLADQDTKTSAKSAAISSVSSKNASSATDSDDDEREESVVRAEDSDTDGDGTGPMKALKGEHRKSVRPSVSSTHSLSVSSTSDDERRYSESQHDSVNASSVSADLLNRVSLSVVEPLSAGFCITPVSQVGLDRL